MSDSLSGSFSILWEAKTKRDIFAAWLIAGGSRLLWEHGDMKGFSCFDPDGLRELWEYRSRTVVSEPLVLGDWILTELLDDWDRICAKTGASSKVAGLKPGDFLVFSNDRFGVFALDEEEGCAGFNVATGLVRQFCNAPEFLSPLAGDGGRFLAAEETEEEERYWVGTLCPESGAVLRARSTKIEAPPAVDCIGLVAKTTDGFLLGDSENCRLWYYSWNGELVSEGEHPGAHDDPRTSIGSSRVVQDVDGSWLLLAVRYTKGFASCRLFCLELGTGIHLRWDVEVPFILGDGIAFLPGRMTIVFGDHGFTQGATDAFGDGKNSALVVSLNDGSIHLLTDEPVTQWVAASDRGLFLGNGAPGGRKRIRYGEFASG